MPLHLLIFFKKVKPAKGRQVQDLILTLGYIYLGFIDIDIDIKGLFCDLVGRICLLSALIGINLWQSHETQALSPQGTPCVSRGLYSPPPILVAYSPLHWYMGIDTPLHWIDHELMGVVSPWIFHWTTVWYFTFWDLRFLLQLLEHFPSGFQGWEGGAGLCLCWCCPRCRGPSKRCRGPAEMRN